jgi:hypothetical protein
MIRFLAKDRRFLVSFFHSVQTGSSVHPTSYPVRTGVSFLGGKEAGA